MSKTSKLTQPLFQMRNDNVGKHLKKFLKDYVFDEFSLGYLEKTGLDFMRGIPIPLRIEEYRAFKDGEGFELTQVIKNMVCIIGIDPNFKYVSSYLKFIDETLGRDGAIQSITNEGEIAADKGDFDKAIVYCRTLLILKPSDLNAMYGYARVCKELYARGNNNEYIGHLKKESMEYLELLTKVHPEFEKAYYYLGYDYLNLGLYQKAALTFEAYLSMSTDAGLKEEVGQRLNQLAIPIEIEKGYNSVLAGRWDEGILILEPFLETDLKNWWPIHYYLGVAYASLGNSDEAISSFKKVLKINGSHIESMEELACLYEAIGDGANEQKYLKKIDLIRREM